MNAFIDEHRARCGVEPICTALQVARSAYRQHAARQRDPTLLPARAKRDAQLLPGLRGVRRGKSVRTTVPDAKAACPLDRVNRQFQADRPNQLWVADFSYVSTWPAREAAQQ